MFIKETIHELSQGEFPEVPAHKIQQWEENYAGIQSQLEHWKSLPELSSDDIRCINNALYEHIKAEATWLMICHNPAAWQENGGKLLAEELIKLLLPLKSSDITERIKQEFVRQDMCARVSYAFSRIHDIMMDELDFIDIEEADELQNRFRTDLSKVTCPLDSVKIFMQFLNNHVSDGNWQRVSCARNQHARWQGQRELLELEYEQCQYQPGDPDYAIYENKYRVLRNMIEIECDSGPAGFKNGITPWTLRNIIRSRVTLSPKAEKKRWTWLQYCDLKDIVNGKQPQERPPYWQLRSRLEKLQPLDLD